MKDTLSSFERKFSQASVLTKKLQESLALEEAIPDVFRYGSVKTCVFSVGDRGRPMFRITLGDGSFEEKPLVEMPPEIISFHRNLIDSKVRFPPVHNDWRKAKKMIDPAEVA